MSRFNTPPPQLGQARSRANGSDYVVRAIEEINPRDFSAGDHSIEIQVWDVAGNYSFLSETYYVEAAQKGGGNNRW